MLLTGELAEKRVGNTGKTEKKRQKAFLAPFVEVRRRISLPAATSEVIIHQKKQTDPI